MADMINHGSGAFRRGEGNVTGAIPIDGRTAPDLDIPALQPLPRHADLMTFQVQGDNMAPTIKPGDYVVATPCSGFRGDGIYLIKAPFEWATPEPYRVTRSPNGVLIIRDNPLYPTTGDMTVEEFGRLVVAEVFGVMNMLHRPIMRGAA